VTGAGRYVDDVRLPGMAYAAVLRSPIAHGRIVRCDPAAAMATAGVLDVLTPHEAAGARLPCTSIALGQRLTSYPVLEEDIRYAGQPVAMVVVELTLRLGRVAPCPIEPRGAVADWDPVRGELTLWIATQAPHQTRDHVADALGLRYDRVRVISGDIGGGFGAKEHPYPDEVLACLAARRLRRPVKWMAPDPLARHAGWHEGRRGKRHDQRARRGRQRGRRRAPPDRGPDHRHAAHTVRRLVGTARRPLSTAATEHGRH
jgi:aerobic carbon-monoxide dehydrogenase large subunit